MYQPVQAIGGFRPSNASAASYTFCDFRLLHYNSKVPTGHLETLSPGARFRSVSSWLFRRLTPKRKSAKFVTGR